MTVIRCDGKLRLPRLSASANPRAPQTSKGSEPRLYHLSPTSAFFGSHAHTRQDPLNAYRLVLPSTTPRVAIKARALLGSIGRVQIADAGLAELLTARGISLSSGWHLSASSQSAACLRNPLDGAWPQQPTASLGAGGCATIYRKLARKFPAKPSNDSLLRCEPRPCRIHITAGARGPREFLKDTDRRGAGKRSAAFRNFNITD